MGSPFVKQSSSLSQIILYESGAQRVAKCSDPRTSLVIIIAGVCSTLMVHILLCQLTWSSGGSTLKG